MSKRGNSLLPHWPAILQACAENMKRQALPLLGAAEAKRGFGLGAGGDVKKQIDLAAENTLTQTLQKHHVSCTLISEESGIQQIGTSPSEFILTADPIDGTANAVHGLPFVAISLAVSKKPLLSHVEAALVTDVVHDINYTAEKGKGAFKNGKKVTPSDAAELEEAIVGVDFSSFRTEQLVAQLRGVLQRARHLRHLGANALEICYVADGTTDAFIDIRGKLRVTDVAAAYLILLEAGGIINAFEGSILDAPLNPTQRVSFIAAANKHIYEAIMNLLNRL